MQTISYIRSRLIYSSSMRQVTHKVHWIRRKVDSGGCICRLQAACHNLPYTFTFNVSRFHEECLPYYQPCYSKESLSSTDVRTRDDSDDPDVCVLNTMLQTYGNRWLPRPQSHRTYAVFTFLLSEFCANLSGTWAAGRGPWAVARVTSWHILIWHVTKDFDLLIRPLGHVTWQLIILIDLLNAKQVMTWSIVPCIEPRFAGS